MKNQLDENEIKSCLLEIGCKQVEDVIENLKNDNLKNAIHLLKIERCHLLGKLHHEQKKIDCLDYLIYSLKDNNQK